MRSAITSTSTSGVVTVTIDRPTVNALTPADWTALGACIDTASNDTTTAAVLLDGGDGRFCAGADIEVLTQSTDDPAMMLTVVSEACSSIRACRVPVLAAIDGPAHGGGLELALACDIRIASQRATFAASGVNMGVIASVQTLLDVVGETRARSMLLTGERIGAQVAHEWSLVTAIEENPRRAATSVARRIATKPPLAVEANKLALRAARSMSSEAHSEFMRELFSDLARTEDHQEAVRAFLEKREGKYYRR